MKQIPDHPAIRSAEKYGYRTNPKVFDRCCACNDEIYCGEDYFDVGCGVVYCVKCGEKFLRKEAV